MEKIKLNRDWEFAHGTRNPWGMGDGIKTVQLPHDYMIESDVREDAPSGGASGYYNAATAHYNKMVDIPGEWAEERVYLYFDGAMMNATVEVNGSKAALHHYGYSPFAADLSDLLTYGEKNRITITVNPSMQPNSRWYSGAGLFRGVTLMHGPAIHLMPDGIFAWTRKIEEDTAYLNLRAEIENHTMKPHIAEVSFTLEGETRKTRVQLDPGKVTTAYATMTVDHPRLWSAEEPNCSQMRVSVKDLGIFTTHYPDKEGGSEDADEVTFGIRTVDADVRHGLRINGETVKLKGGCLHHDNGPLGTVTLPDAEFRKVRKLKELGFNAIRTTHNPPSAALIDACDRLGMYVFDEAFDAWGMGKQPGDYNQFFETDWQADLSAFIRRDRSHPSVIIWSTGNEITERAGLGNGYSLARRLAEHVRAMDPSRPVSNGICSFWSGLDDHMNKKNREQMDQAITQNASFFRSGDTVWETNTEPFTAGLDIVGYNYLEDLYPQDHEMFPERIILGSENYPKEVGQHWPMIEKTPWVIGEFTWTAWDYIGEAGIGRAEFFEPDSPEAKAGGLILQIKGVTYPWRTANDADIDILGNVRPQGIYRKIVFGSAETGLFSYDPDNTDKAEVLTPWGFIGVEPCWNWEGKENRPVRVVVFSGAEEVKLLLNGKEIGALKAGEKECPGLPKSFCFETVYVPGELEAVSYTGGEAVSRAVLKTAGSPAKLRLVPETKTLKADGESLCYIGVEVLDGNGQAAPQGEIALTAKAEGAATLAGFGSGKPWTEENYTTGRFSSWHGKALAILRAGTETGEVKLTVSGKGMEDVSVTIPVE